MYSGGILCSWARLKEYHIVGKVVIEGKYSYSNSDRDHDGDSDSDSNSDSNDDDWLDYKSWNITTLWAFNRPYNNHYCRRDSKSTWL